GNLFDALLGRKAAFGADAGDRDRAILGDIDGGPGLFGDSTDYCPAFADDVANLLRLDLDHDHAWSVDRDLCARGLQRLLHQRQDVNAPFARLVQGDLHDLLGDALNLD